MRMSKEIKIIVAALIVVLLYCHFLTARMATQNKKINSELNNINRVLDLIVLGKNPISGDFNYYELKYGFEKSKEMDPLHFLGIHEITRKIAKLENKANRYDELFQYMYEEKIAGVNKFESKSAEDTTITNWANRQNENLGIDGNLKIGNLYNRNMIQRSLIRFADLNKIPSNAKVIAAVLFLKQDFEPKFDRVDNQNINLYEIKREWSAGSIDRDTTEENLIKDYSTWFYAKYKHSKWSTPGLWMDPKDVDDKVLATATHVHVPTYQPWVKFYFNKNGLMHLQRIVEGEPNYGWLIKIENENNLFSQLIFTSSDYYLLPDHPYLQVYYLLP